MTTHTNAEAMAQDSFKSLWLNYCEQKETIAEQANALLQALEALKGWMDQPDTTEAYDASMTRAQAAIAAIEGVLK